MPVDCYKPNYAGDANQIGKQLRWPLKEQGTNGGDFWLDKRTSAFYCYRKYNEFEKGRLISRSRCHTDWPLIRYTDVLLQYAEALAQTDQLGEAIRLVNKVRTRAHMPALTEGGSGPCAVNGKEDMLEGYVMNVAWNSVWKESTSSMKYVGEPTKKPNSRGKT